MISYTYINNYNLICYVHSDIINNINCVLKEISITMPIVSKCPFYFNINICFHSAADFTLLQPVILLLNKPSTVASKGQMVSTVSVLYFVSDLQSTARCVLSL